MKFLLASLLLFFQFLSIGQSSIDLFTEKTELNEESNHEFLFIPELSRIKSDLKGAPHSDVRGLKWVKVSLPFADGKYYDLEVAEAPVVAKKIYDRYPENRSYKVRGINDNYISGRMSITPKGISALLFTKTGNVFIEPAQGQYHKSYDFDSSVLDSFSCGTDHSNFKNAKSSSTRASFGSNELKYTIAIASSGEFSAKHGNNLANVNAIINDYLTLLNTIYERDLAITFELTANNDDIIFFNPNTDGLNPSNNSSKLSSAQSVIGSTIGSGNYDIGHVFHELNPPANGWTGSGVASLGVVCSSSSKARGWSSCGGSYPSSFWMGIFAHEVGHQFQATHTFYGTSGNCAGSQRSIGNGVEPGSGNSLMSYEGTCWATGSCENQNISPESDFLYFHGHSIDQIHNFVTGSGSCYSSSSSGNSPPIITMPASKTIPKQTPFYLSATVTDPDGDPLLFSWEEVDTDNLSLSCPAGDPNDAATSTTAPLFRSFDPSEDGSIRYFPRLSDILNNTQTKGEILPEVGRTIDMRFTARGIDANGISGVSYEDLVVTVAGNSGPFEVTTAETPIGYTAGELVDVEWIVGNTNNAPVSCSHVNILFSNDGGMTFPITLASNTPNDGIEIVTMPNNGTEVGRIKVEAADNIFFSINKGDITIISDCITNSTIILNDEDVTANAGDPSLNLELLVGGAEISSVSDDLVSTDPISDLTTELGNSGTCFQTSFYTPFHKAKKFMADQSDTYTFIVSGNILEIVNIYQDEFIPPAANCLNWLASSASYNAPTVTFGNSVSVTLAEGDIIEMAVSGFYTGQTGSYTVNISSSGTGALLDPAIIPVGFSYKYVIYNSSGFIVGIQDEADLTDSNLFSNDVYTVKGLLVLSTANLTPYINGSFTSIQNAVITGAICGAFSSNDVSVTINGCNSGIKTVTSLLDNGAIGTLRYKVENACPGDIIQIDPSLLNATIFLNSEIVIDANLSIMGLGMNSFAISGNNNNRIFNVSSGVNATISNMTLSNGFAFNNGGAFINNGSLVLSNLKFEGNLNGSIPKAFTNLGSVSIENTINVLE